MLLYKTKRAPQQGINRAFSTVQMPGLTRFLYENEKISDEALVAAFEKAMGVKHSKILVFLSQEKCIPVGLIYESVLQAVQAHATEVVECLCYNLRFTSVAMTKAFVIAATSGYADLVRIIYNKQHISPETLLKTFTEAAHRGHLDATRLIMSFMTIQENVPREFKCKALVVAARHGQMPVVPLQVLKQALDAAGDGNDKIVKLIRKRICGQELLKLHQPVYHTA